MGFSVVDYAAKKKKSESAEEINSSSATTAKKSTGGFSVRDYAIRKNAPSYAAQQQSDYQAFRDKVVGYSKSTTSDAKKRAGQYQDSKQFSSYFDTKNSEASDLLKQAYTFRDQWTQDGNKEYLSDVDELISYLNGARDDLFSEQRYWSQFKDRAAYDEIQKQIRWRSLGQENKEIGQYGQGNIDLYNRPQLQNGDGSISTVASMSINEDGKEILIPTIAYDALGNAVQLSDEQAIQRYHDTGEYLGKFNSVEEANDYADKLHTAQDFYYNSQYKSTYDPEKEKFNAFTGTYTDTGFEDILYDYINKNEKAQGHQMVNDTNANTTHDYWKDLPDDVVSTFNYIYATEGRDAAYQYVNMMSDKRYTGMEALTYGVLNGTGLSSVSAALGAGASKLLGNEDALQRNKDWYNDMQLDAYKAQEQHPVAYGAGAVGGSMALLSGLSTGIGSIAGFSELPAIAQTIISGAGTMGGMSAIQGIGNVSTGNTTPGQYFANVGVNAASGGLGGALSGAIGNAGFTYLTNKGLANNIFARSAIAGLSGSSFAAGNTGTKLLASKLGYKSGEEITTGQLVQDVLVGFAFGTISYLIRNSGGNFTAKEPEYQWKYFDKNMTAEEAKALYRKLAFENHPDRGGSNEVMAAINSEYERFVNEIVNKAANAYSTAAKAHAAGNEQAAAKAEAEFSKNMLVIQGYFDEGIIAGTEAAEAMEVLNSVMSNGIVSVSDGTNTIESSGPVTLASLSSSGSISEQLIAAGVTAEDAEKLAPAIESVLNGEEISGNQAGAIARNEAAVSVLETVTGEQIETDAPLSEVKDAIKALASRQEAQEEAHAPVDITEETSAVEMPVSPTSDMQPIYIDEAKRSILNEFASALGKNGKSTMIRMYTGKEDPGQYAENMTRAYNAGLNGEALERANLRANMNGILIGANMPQIKAAYLAGQADAGVSPVAEQAKENYTGISRNEEGLSYGESEVHLRESGQRADGANPGRELRTLEESAGRDQSWEISGRPADRGSSSLSYGKEVSTSSLGIGKGATNDRIRIVTGGETDATRKAKELGNERGIRVIFFGGNNLSIGSSNGNTASVRAYISGDRAFIRVDHPEYTAEQLMKHEVCHDMIAKGEIDPDSVRKRISEKFGSEKTEALAGMYESAYRESGLTADEVWEEVICDSLGDMNIFHDIPVLEDNAKELLEETRAASVADLETNRTRGPPSGVQGVGVHQGAGVQSADGGVTTSQEVKPGKEDNVNGGKEISDPGNAESAGRVVQTDQGGKASKRERYESRVREILQKYATSSRRNREQSGRVEKKETRNDFEDRMRADGYFYAETKNGVAAMGFKPAPEEKWSGEAKTANDALKKWGFEVIVFDGEMHTNRKGVSDISSAGQTLRDGMDITIFLSSDLDIDGLETAYHEALHAIRTGPNSLYRVKIENAILDNIDVECNAFESFVTRIADLYSYSVRDVSENRFAAEITEESYAWFVGKIHAEDGGSMLKIINQFADVKTAKKQIDEVFESLNQKGSREKVSTGGEKAKFSMETPVEETRTLLAIHNKDEESILSALDLGGLPMPSIAVVKAADGHNQYGPISLVFSKDTIDPQADRRNKVYGSDAWTPTHSDARVDYEVDYDVKREFEQNIETLAKDVAGGIFSQSSVLDMAGVGDQTSMSVEEIAHRLATRYDSVRAAYLANKGQDINVVYRTKEFDSFGNDALKSYLDKVGEQEAARLAAKILNGERLSTEEVDTVKDSIMESWTAKNEWRLNKKPELRDTRIAKQREKLSDLRAEDFARNAWDFYENGGTTTDEVNRMETAENLRHEVDDKAVEAWVLDMLRGLTGEPGIYNGSELFDARGNRKSFKETHWSYTLENIVRAMNNAKSRGQGMWGMSGSGLVATATPAYNSVQEMHADESRLRTVDSAEYEQMVKDLDGELSRVAADIMRTTEHHASNTFEEEEIIGDVIAMAAQGKRTTAGVKQTFRKEGYTISDKQAGAVLGVIEHASNVPTGYFEAKPQRAVGFDEVLAAVIPDDSSEKLRTGLEQAGVRMLEYKSGDDADRLAKVNSVEDAKFSQEISALNQMRKDSQGRTLTEQQREYFKDSKTVDDQGRLMVMYHGTRKGGFTVFRDWSYLTGNRKYAERYMDRDTGETMYEVYANIRRPFDTRLEECRTIWENEFYGEYSRTALQESGLPDWTDGYDLVDFLEDNGYDYDAILLDEGADQINGSVVERGISYVVRSSEQIKSVDNKTPTDNPDIRFSQDIAELDALRKENERLKGRVEHWKGQLKQTTPETRTLRQVDVDKLARRLVKEYGGTLDASNISGKLKSLGEFIIRGGDGKDDLTWAGVHEKALDIARDLVENAVVMNDDMYREYSDLRNYLRTTKIIYGKEYHGDIPDYGDFRKGQFGRLNLGSDGATNIDQVYQELSSRWPEFFNEQEQSHPTDQLLQIADVLDGLQPIYENPYSYDMAAAEEYAAADILDSLMGEDVRQEPPTYADRQARKLEDAKAKGRQQVQQVRERANERLARQREQSKQRMQTAIDRERKRRDERVQQLKDHYAEVRKNQAARRADSKARTRLLNIARRLQNKKLPAVNRALLDQYIGDLDTVSKGMTGKTLEKLSDLQSWYNDRKENDPDFISDPNIERTLSRLSKRHISDMTADDVADLTRILLNIENELRTEHKLIDDAERRDTYHLGQETIQDIYNTKGSRGVLDKFIVTETLSPLRQVRRMTGYVDSDPLYKLTQSLADGQRSMLDYQMKAERPFEKFASDKAFSKTFSGPKAGGIQITGFTKDGEKTVTITPAMRVSLYLHSLNDQNLRHIKEGGITVPDEKLYRKGKLDEAYARGTTIKLAPSQVRAITASMTEKEKAFARAAHKYFNETSRAAINATSEKLKGYSLAQVDNYFPINTDSSFTRSEFETLKRDGTIEGMGFLKERVRASNPILLRDANSVLEQAIRMHGKYVGLAIPVRNFNKVWSVTTGSYNEDGSRSNYDGSVQQAVKQRWGDTGYCYIEKLMTDLQGGSAQKNVWVKALNRVRSNYAGAVLTLNLSVAMKQAASYPTAAAVLGWRPLARAMSDFGKVDLARIEKYTPLQWYRSKGFSTKELGDLKTADRQLPPVLNWVQGVDLLTTRKLWKASEYYVRQNNKELSVGTGAYWRAVADIYNRVIEETQPNYTTMQRPQLLRSDDTLMGNLAMFKTQPFQNFNIVYDAAGNYIAKAERARNGGEQEKADAKKAKSDLGHAITSQLAQLAVFAGMTMVWALLRGKTGKYEDNDGEITVSSILSALGKDMAGGTLSSIPFGSDAWELLSSKVFGDTYYGMDAVTVTAISDTIQALSDLSEQMGRIVKNAASGKETNWNSERLKLDRELDRISKAAGVPYENVVNLFKIAFLHTAVASQGEYLGEYAYLKMTSDPEKNISDYYDLMFRALQNGFVSDYKKIRSDFMDFSGKDGDSIDIAMRSRYDSRRKKDRSFRLPSKSGDIIGWTDKFDVPDKEDAFSADDLDASAYQAYSSQKAKTYREIVSGLERNDGYGQLSGEEKNKALSAAKSLSEDISLRDHSGGQFTDADMNQWERWASGGDRYGVDETEAILFKLAYEMAESEKDKNGNTISGSKKKNTLEIAGDLLPDLSDIELAYLMSIYWTPDDKELKAMKESGFIE